MNKTISGDDFFGITVSGWQLVELPTRELHIFGATGRFHGFRLNVPRTAENVPHEVRCGLNDACRVRTR